MLLSTFLFFRVVVSDCTITQKCLNPGNIPDYDKCIPEANVGAVPLPMLGEGWPNVTGGGNCSTAADCSNKGVCSGSGTCVCNTDGITAGAHCDEIAIQCPAYRDAACCSWQQNHALADNFKLIGSLFGKNKNGGCDACAANMMQMWCGLICAPTQSEFMRLHSSPPSVNHRLDPLSGKTTKVLELNVAFKTDTACSVFSSCQHTTLVSTIEAMKSSLGFLEYQAQTGAIGHGEYMYLSFDETARGGFQFDTLDCSDYKDVEVSSLPAQAQILPSLQASRDERQCPCSSCRPTCTNQDRNGSIVPVHFEADPISALNGLNVPLVMLFYGLIAVVVFVRSANSKNHF